MSWIEISKEEAKQNQYYGIKGWLLLFIIFGFLGLANGIFNDFMITINFDIDLPPGAGELESHREKIAAAMASAQSLYPSVFHTIGSVVALVITVVPLGLLVMKKRIAPTAVIVGVWLYGAINLVWFFLMQPYFEKFWTEAGFDVANLASAVWLMVPMIGLMFCLVNGLITWYFLSSKRVNITYLHRIPPMLSSVLYPDQELSDSDDILANEDGTFSVRGRTYKSRESAEAFLEHYG